MALFEDTLTQDTPQSSMLAEPSSTYPDSSLISTPPGTPNEGVGLAAPATPEKTTMQRVGEALYNFHAGSEGKSLWAERQQALKRQDQQTKLLALKETTESLEQGVKLAQGMEGDARTSFVDAYAKRLDQIDPGIGATFKMAADRPDIVKSITGIMPYMPEPMQVQAKMDPQGFLKTLGSAEGLKALDAAKSQFNLRTATQKAQMILTHAQQFGIPDELVQEYQKNPTASLFLKMERMSNDPRVRFSADEQTAVTTHADIFYQPLGMMSPKGEEAIREDKAKKATPSASDTANLAETTRHHGELEDEARKRLELERQRLDQDKWSAPIEVSIEGKNALVRMDKKSGRVIDANGKDITDKIAPQIKGAPLDPGRVSMLLQAHKDITDARAMLFDEKGELNRSVIAAMDVPGTKGVGTEGRKAYSAIENAVAAKLRGETGAATNPGEIENTAARFRPTMMDTKESAKYKIDRLQEFMGMSLDQLRESYHISQETYDKAKGGNRGERGGEPIAMPANKSELVPGKDYATSRGVATWNGTEFVAKKK